MRDTYDLMKYLEYLLHDTQSQMWDNLKKLNALNGSYDQIVNRIIDLHENYFYTEATLTPGTAAWERTPFDFPAAPSTIAKILYVTTLDGFPLQPTNLALREFTYPSVSDKWIKTSWWMGHDKIYVNADAWTENLRLYYVRRPPRLQYGTAEAGADTTMILDADTKPSIEDDYYNNITFTIREGTGAEEEAVASDYVGNTRVLTVDFTTTPSTDSVYSSVPEIPNGHREIIAYGAAIRALQMDVAQNEKLANLERWYAKLEFDLMDFVKNRQLQAGRSVFMSNTD